MGWTGASNDLKQVHLIEDDTWRASGLLMISGFFFLVYLSHSEHATTRKISDPSMISKWEK